MLVELKKLIEANPLFRDKLNFPSLKNARLRTLINQRYIYYFSYFKPGSYESGYFYILTYLSVCSLNWQHQLCKNPKANPDIKTLFIDHSCGQSQTNARAVSPVTNALMGGLLRPAGFAPLGAHGVRHIR